MKRRCFLQLGGAAATWWAAAGAAPAVRPGGMARKFRVGVIGASGRGGYGHGLDTMWGLMAECDVVAVADADPTGLGAARARLGVERGFADYRRMLEEIRPEIVAVCPRHVDQHRDMVLAAVESGARGIFIEKPFCRSPEEADQIVAGCERRGVKLAVAHRNRYHPALPVVVRLLAEGAIGRLLEMRGRGKEDARGGAEDLWVLGSHVLNLAHHLGGAPRACSAWIEQGGHPVTRADVVEGNEGLGPLAGDTLHARYDMECGAPLHFDSLRLAGRGGTNFGLQLFGNEGIIDLRIDRQPLAHLLEGNPFLPATAPRAWVPVSSAGVGVPEPDPATIVALEKHVLAGRDLLAAIVEDRAPLCDARQGAMSVEMICAVFESHRQGGRRVTLPLAQRGNPLAKLGA